MKIEVTDKYIKEIFAGSYGVYTRVVFFQKAEFRIITRSDIYQVSAYDAENREIWAFRPASKDLETCQRMVNSIDALTKRVPAPATTPNAVH